jgi:hypothetical protein
MQHIKWPGIGLFHNVRKNTTKYIEETTGSNRIVDYKCKTKLHGSNASLVFTEDGIAAQSRNRILTPDRDNAGFAMWALRADSFWKDVHKRYNKDLVVFGEYIGPKIQRGMASNQISKPVFAIFAVHGIDLEGDIKYPDFTVEPDEIRKIVPEDKDLGIYIIPWLEGEDLTIDWSLSGDNLLPLVEKANKVVERVERCDPFIKDNFGIEGLGEGVVYYPMSHPGRYYFGNLAFKAKGEGHKTVQTAKSVQVSISPETVDSINKFVDLTVTEARLEQGAREISGGELSFDIKKTGRFIGWICGDIAKECKTELAASKLSWKPVGKAISTKAREWYIANWEKLD